MVILLNDGLNHFIDFDRLSRQVHPIIVDAGAAKGEFIEAILKFLKISPARIIAIECAKRNLEVLRSKVVMYHLELCEKALVGARRIENKVMFTEFVGKEGRFYQWSNIYGNHEKELQQRRNLEAILHYYVPIVRISELFEELRVDHIDYLKMDIEGAEAEVIGTMPPEIAEKIFQLSFEYHKPILFE